MNIDITRFRRVEDRAFQAAATFAAAGLVAAIVALVLA